MKNSSRIVCLGDSITNGYDGFQDLIGHSYPDYLQQLLHTPVLNLGYNGAYLANDSTPGDLTKVVYQTDFSQFSLVTIAYGTNDYGHSRTSLANIAASLQNNLTAIKDNHAAIKILGILPLTRYDYEQNADNLPGIAGYTINELRNTLATIYQKNDATVLDWRVSAPTLITDTNHYERFHDHRLHPSAATYQKMGTIIANYIKEKNLL